MHNDGDIPADVSSVVQSDATYVYGLGLISATDQTGAQRYYFSDGLGSTMVRVNGSAGGAVGDVYTYDVFGNLRSGNASSETMLFTGQQFDNKALGPDKGGLYYLRQRYYDPTLGRFLTQDPMRGSASSPQTANPYAYVSNNPTNWVDPSGLDREGAQIFGCDAGLLFGAIFMMAVGLAIIGLSVSVPGGLGAVALASETTTAVGVLEGTHLLVAAGPIAAGGGTLGVFGLVALIDSCFDTDIRHLQ
ncbi:MAG: RHS repeat-associated core domain-containing protein [Dehalococcoidia bacterium]